MCCLAHWELAWFFHELHTHIQGWMAVWESYCHALEKWCLFIVVASPAASNDGPQGGKGMERGKKKKRGERETVIARWCHDLQGVHKVHTYFKGVQMHFILDMKSCKMVFEEWFIEASQAWTNQTAISGENPLDHPVQGGDTECGTGTSADHVACYSISYAKFCIPTQYKVIHLP